MCGENKYYQISEGMADTNTGIAFEPYVPFVGVRKSGFDRERGWHGVEEFQISKTATLDGLDMPMTKF